MGLTSAGNNVPPRVVVDSRAFLFRAVARRKVAPCWLVPDSPWLRCPSWSRLGWRSPPVRRRRRRFIVDERERRERGIAAVGDRGRGAAARSRHDQVRHPRRWRAQDHAGRRSAGADAAGDDQGLLAARRRKGHEHDPGRAGDRDRRRQRVSRARPRRQPDRGERARDPLGGGRERLVEGQDNVVAGNHIGTNRVGDEAVLT